MRSTGASDLFFLRALSQVAGARGLAGFNEERRFIIKGFGGKSRAVCADLVFLTRPQQSTRTGARYHETDAS